MNNEPQSPFLLYQTGDGQTRLEIVVPPQARHIVDAGKSAVAVRFKTF